MEISYNPLWSLLETKNIKKTELREKCSLGASTYTKLNNNENVTTETLLKICEFLDCDIQDIMKVEKNSNSISYSPRVLDLFCGAGGLSLGFKQAGFTVVGGVDFDIDAINTHERNFPNSINVCGDIRGIENESIQQMFGKTVDVIIGGPPCQGFSSANKWQSDEEKIEKNRLFFEYIRFIEVLKPKVFVIENVRQILTSDEGYAKNEITKICTDLGYTVTSEVLDASEYGVPQKRLRAFFVGIRNDLGADFKFKNIKKLDKIVTVSDAISDMYNCEFEGLLVKKPETDYQKRMRANSGDIIYNHTVTYPNDKVQERMKFVPQGGNWRDVPEELWDTIRNNRHSSAYRRLDETKSSITIDTGHMNYFHPKYNRVPTVRESARIQSFPDDFIFTGSKGAQFRQVGNAVPPLLSEKIATEILKVLTKGN